MSSEEQEVYMMQDDDQAEEWVRPTPASAVILDAVSAETDLDREEMDTLGAYVDLDELGAVLRANESDQLQCTIEGYDVTITSDGDIQLSE